MKLMKEEKIYKKIQNKMKKEKFILACAKSCIHNCETRNGTQENIQKAKNFYTKVAEEALELNKKIPFGFVSLSL